MRTTARIVAGIAMLAAIVVGGCGSRGGSSLTLAASITNPITPSGWELTPAGKVITVPPGKAGLPGPWGVALSPDGRYALVTSSGAAVKYETTEVYDVTTGDRTALEKYNGYQGESVFYGVVFSADGKQAWASGAGQQVVHAYRVTSSGGLKPVAEIKAPYFPSGLACGQTPRGERVYVAENLGALSNPDYDYEDQPGHVVSVIDPATNKVTARIGLGRARYPLAVAFDRQGDKAYVTNWAGRRVSVIDTARQKTVATIVLSPHASPLTADHPTGIASNPKRDEVYVANANSDTVSVIDTQTDAVAATIDVALVPGGPKGSTPVGLAVSPDGDLLYVTDAGENAIAVVDVENRTVLGFIPTGWYPSSIQVTPDGTQLVVTNTYGSGPGPNPAGPFVPKSLYPSPAPTAPYYYYPGDWYTPPLPESQYSGTMVKGSLEVIDLPGTVTQDSLAGWSAQVKVNDHATGSAGAKPAALDAIKHVIYVIKENRTYDQVFGDLGEGNGDADLTLFKQSSSPNHRSLASKFVLFDDFYVDSEVSQDGHPWTTQAISTDYTDKIWPFDYAWAYSRSYDSEFVPLEQQFKSEPLAEDTTVPRSVAAATVGYLWDDAAAHNVTYRDYGESTASKTVHGKTVWYSDLTHLQARFGVHVDPRYVGWDMSAPDHKVREPEWQREFRQFEKNGDLPGLEIVYLPMDHTEGMTPGDATPESFMADNDLALGRLVDVVSHSKYWASTAIFVVEDDAQDGPDHVDSHRSPCFVISPYTQHATIDSTHYDTAAMLATMEQLLGLSPMSIFDQRATPMWDAFSSTPDLTPYAALTPKVTAFGDRGYPRITSDSKLARECARLDFSGPDEANEEVLNEAIWAGVRGSLAGYPERD